LLAASGGRGGEGRAPAPALRDRRLTPASIAWIGRRKGRHMGEDTTALGGIHISPRAIAAIAYHATLRSYGVVGLAPKNIAEGLAQTITHEPARGVSVRYDGENIDIDVYIIVEYGTRIMTVAEGVANVVRYNVERALGMPIHEVNVHVAGLRISNPI